MVLFDTDKERQLLGALIDDPTLIDKVILKPKQIYNNKNKHLLEAILKINTEGKEVELIILYQELNESWKLSELVEIKEQGSIYRSSFNTLQNQLIELYKKKSFNDVLVQSLNTLNNGQYESSIESMNRFLIADSENQENQLVGMNEAIESTLVKLEECYNKGGKINGMLTGYSKLDNTLNGIEKGRYIVIAARPGVGKSALATELSKRLSMRNKVLFFNVEMTKEEITHRLLANSARIPMMKLKRGTVGDGDWNTIAQKSSFLSRLKLKLDCFEGLTIEELERRARREARANGLDVIIIDYITLLNTEARFNTTRDKVNYISEHIRQLAKSLNVAIIALSQLGRGAEGKEIPTIADLRESGNIEQDAAVILLLQEKERDQDKQETDQLYIHIAKNRGGRKGVIRFNYYKSTQIIDEA